ncbi:MAG: hypothetical protein D6736_17645 [Nitrospinota bacterium]|nr:MAG: hypothetical protein D6736_17645 [Nitrospinota bacterium]
MIVPGQLRFPWDVDGGRPVGRDTPWMGHGTHVVLSGETQYDTGNGVVSHRFRENGDVLFFL